MNLKQAKGLRAVIIQAVRNGALDPRDIYQTKMERRKVGTDWAYNDDGSIYQETVEYPGQRTLPDWCAKGAYRRAKLAFKRANRYGENGHIAAMASLTESVDAHKARQDLRKRKPL
jgi:hypothetical protein